MNEWFDGETVAIQEGFEKAMEGKASDYCCVGAIHDGSVRLVGNMGALETKLGFAEEVHQFKVCLDSEYIMLKFPDNTEFAQVSDLLTRGLGAVHKLCPDGDLDVRAFAKSADARNILQRAKRPAEAVPKYPDGGLGLHGLECHNPHAIEFPGLDYVPRDCANGSDPADGAREADTSEGQENERRAISGAYESLTRDKNLERVKAGSGIRTQLLPRQERALGFMLERENGPTPEGYSLWERTIPESGGAEVCKATLILVPSALIMQTSWKPEIENRLGKLLKVTEYYGKFRDNEQELYESSNVVFSTYHTVAASLKRPGSAPRQISWFRIILDEAHTIRRKETALFKAALELSANFR
ncbi:hypothetical protein RB594_009319 [Gaeumannomyces avenae]